MELVEILKERKLTRSELSSILATDDRTARRYIETLRKNGHLIANNGLGDGYFIPNKKVDADPFMLEYYAHFKTMADTMLKLIEVYNELED